MEKICLEVGRWCARAGHRCRNRSTLFEYRHLGGHLGYLLRELEFLMLDSHQTLLE
jgi:predicted alpha/beta-fold hydrolase